MTSRSSRAHARRGTVATSCRAARMSSDLLRAERCKRGLSQLTLSLEAPISARHLSCLESGKASPGKETVHRLIRALAMHGEAAARLAYAAGSSAARPRARRRSRACSRRARIRAASSSARARCGQAIVRSTSSWRWSLPRPFSGVACAGPGPATCLSWSVIPKDYDRFCGTRTTCSRPPTVDREESRSRTRSTVPDRWRRPRVENHRDALHRRPGRGAARELRAARR